MPIRHIRRKRLREDVETAYFKLQMACEPETLNPEKPGNLAYMKSDARDSVNILYKEIKRAGFDPPHICEATEGSLHSWFNFIRYVLVEIS